MDITVFTAIVIFALLCILVCLRGVYITKQNYKYQTLSNNANLKCSGAYDLLSRLSDIDADTHTFADLLELHKEIWAFGIHNSNVCPNAYGVFRTKDIETMTLSEVYLGGYYGLVTLPATEWENCTETMCGNGFGLPEETLCRTLMFNRYKKLLTNGLNEYINKKQNEASEYESKIKTGLL